MPAAEELYRTLKPILLRVAIGKFGIPADLAEELVQDVFVSYIRRRPDLLNTQHWFIGAVSNACRHYWRQNVRYVPLSDADLANSVIAPDVDRVTAHDSLKGLQERDARILWLRFAEGLTVGEIADALGVSRSRTEKLLRRALQRLAEQLGSPPADDTNPWLRGILLFVIDTYVTCARGRPSSVVSCRLSAPRRSAELSPSPEPADN